MQRETVLDAYAHRAAAQLSEDLLELVVVVGCALQDDARDAIVWCFALCEREQLEAVPHIALRSASSTHCCALCSCVGPSPQPHTFRSTLCASRACSPRRPNETESARYSVL